MSPEALGMDTSLKEQTRSQRIRMWCSAHPELWISAVAFVVSCCFLYGFGQVAHWTGGAQSTKWTNFCRWDCSWYSSIAGTGYDRAPRNDLDHSANWGFFPLFPLTGSACKYIFHLDALTATLLAAKIEYFTAIFAFLLWMGPHLQNVNERFLAAMLVAVNPYLIYGHAGYSEPLYFTLLCLGFWALERQKWIVAGLLGAGVSATRIVGVVFALVYVIVAVREVGLRSIFRDRSLKVLAGRSASAVPQSLAVFVRPLVSDPRLEQRR